MPHISEHWRLQCQLCSDLYGNSQVLKYYISEKCCKRTLRDPEGLREGKESLDGARSLEESPRLHYTQFRSSSQILRAWPLVSGAIMSVLHSCTNLGKSLGCPGGAFIPCTSCYLDSVCTYSLRGLFLWLCMIEARRGHQKNTKYAKNYRVYQWQIDLSQRGHYSTSVSPGFGRPSAGVGTYYTEAS